MFHFRHLLIIALLIIAGSNEVHRAKKHKLMEGCIEFIDDYKIFKRISYIVTVLMTDECVEAIGKIGAIYSLVDKYLDSGMTDLKTKREYCKKLTPIMAKHEFAMICLKNVAKIRYGR